MEAHERIPQTLDRKGQECSTNEHTEGTETAN